MSCLTRPRRHRLLRRPDFTACYDAGRRFYSRLFVVFASFRLSEDLDWRLGMAVTKKTGSAVMRNRVKRVLREFFRLHQSLLPPALDLVIVPKRQLKPEQLTLAVATREMLPLLKDLRGFAALRRQEALALSPQKQPIVAPRATRVVTDPQGNAPAGLVSPGQAISPASSAQSIRPARTAPTTSRTDKAGHSA
ncbi:MAG: ribonuclease P protein component [Bilophila sp.]